MVLYLTVGQMRANTFLNEASAPTRHYQAQSDATYNPKYSTTTGYDNFLMQA
jgi:hypothetical protein